MLKGEERGRVESEGREKKRMRLRGRKDTVGGGVIDEVSK